MNGTCANAPAGVFCYGIPLGLKIHILRSPPTHVAVGPQSVKVSASDPRCQYWEARFAAGGSWQHLAMRNATLRMPVLSVGTHHLSVRVRCPGNPPIYSPASFASWTVVDRRPTNTSISGPDLTNERSPTFVLGANKGDCSYEYGLDGMPSSSTTAAASAVQTLRARLLAQPPSVWPHSRAFFVVTSSAGVGTRFDVMRNNETLPTVVVADNDAQAVLTMPQLNSHQVRVRARTVGQSSEPLVASFDVVELLIDTHLVGGPFEIMCSSFLNPHCGKLRISSMLSMAAQTGLFTVTVPCSSAPCLPEIIGFASEPLLQKDTRIHSCFRWTVATQQAGARISVAPTDSAASFTGVT